MVEGVDVLETVGGCFVAGCTFILLSYLLLVASGFEGTLTFCCAFELPDPMVMEFDMVEFFLGIVGVLIVLLSLLLICVIPWTEMH